MGLREGMSFEIVLLVPSICATIKFSMFDFSEYSKPYLKMSQPSWKLLGKFILSLKVLVLSVNKFYLKNSKGIGTERFQVTVFSEV